MLMQLADANCRAFVVSSSSGVGVVKLASLPVTRYARRGKIPAQQTWAKNSSRIYFLFVELKCKLESS